MDVSPVSTWQAMTCLRNVSRVGRRGEPGQDGCARSGTGRGSGRSLPAGSAGPPGGRRRPRTPHLQVQPGHRVHHAEAIGVPCAVAALFPLTPASAFPSFTAGAQTAAGWPAGRCGADREGRPAADPPRPYRAAPLASKTQSPSASGQHPGTALGVLVGAIAMARAVDDLDLSRQILSDAAAALKECVRR